VQNADEAKSAVAYTRYPPAGLRGVAGGTRATRFARVKDYAKRAHEELCVLVQVENQQGLDNLEKIAAVEGVDGVSSVRPTCTPRSAIRARRTIRKSCIIDDAIRRIRKAARRRESSPASKPMRAAARMRRPVRRRRRGHRRARTRDREARGEFKS